MNGKKFADHSILTILYPRINVCSGLGRRRVDLPEIQEPVMFEHGWMHCSNIIHYRGGYRGMMICYYLNRENFLPGFVMMMCGTCLFAPGMKRDACLLVVLPAGIRSFMIGDGIACVGNTCSSRCPQVKDRNGNKGQQQIDTKFQTSGHTNGNRQ